MVHISDIGSPEHDNFNGLGIKNQMDFWSGDLNKSMTSQYLDYANKKSQLVMSMKEFKAAAGIQQTTAFKLKNQPAHVN